MAVNPRPELPNRNRFISGASGMGKSTFMRNDRELAQAKRVIFLDPHEDYQTIGFKVTRFRDPYKFWQAVKAGILSDKYFRLALTVSNTYDNIESFNRYLWAIANGKIELHAVLDEVGVSSKTAGKSGPHSQEVYTGCRKYNVIYHALTQNPAECTKSVIKSADRRLIFGQTELNDIARAAEYARRTREEIENLKTGEYFYRDRSTGAAPGILKVTTF